MPLTSRLILYFSAELISGMASFRIIAVTATRFSNMTTNNNLERRNFVDNELNLLRIIIPSKPNVPELNVVGVGLLGGRECLVIGVSTDG